MKSDTNDILFVGVDGEGVDRPDGAHEYVMLSVGDKTLWNAGERLELKSILQFLWDAYRETPDAAFVGFFLGYDFIQWLKLLPQREAYLLFSPKGIVERKSQRKGRANPYPDAVVWEGWEIDIMAGRRFKLRPHVCHKSEWSGLCRNRTCAKDMGGATISDTDNGIMIDENEMLHVIPEIDDSSVEWKGSMDDFWKLLTRNKHSTGQGKEKVKTSGWMYICDTGAFWQTSFLNVINPESWGDHPVCTQLEYSTVVDGKQDRGHVYGYGEAGYFADMQRYNVLENEILARVTKRLNEGFMNERVPIKIPKTDWYGPGRAAQIWMDQLHELA